MCSNLSNFNYKPQAESRQQHLALYMDRHLRSVAIMIEVTRPEVGNRRPFYSKCAAICGFVNKYIVLTSTYVRHNISMLYHCVLN